MEPEHPLSEWIKGRMSRAEFARQIGVSQSHLTLVLKRERGVSVGVANKIDALTSGAVTSLQLEARRAPKVAAE